ncbi:MAG: sulfur carrier protein ThiS [Proteobacteria bacterium]|nr:sulfur carrier protein ThiS [Pseudomonadota bacterium]
MMHIQINDAVIEVEKGDSLAKVLEQNGVVMGCYSVALNRSFVPRIHYTTTFLCEGDIIDIIIPMQGG